MPETETTSARPALRDAGAGDPAHTPVGTVEIADRLRVTRKAVDQWRARDLGFPAPEWTVGGRPAWRLGDVVEWAAETGRLDGFDYIAVRLREEPDADLVDVPFLPDGLCPHTATACPGCLDTWALDWEVDADRVEGGPVR